MSSKILFCATFVGCGVAAAACASDPPPPTTSAAATSTTTTTTTTTTATPPPATPTSSSPTPPPAPTTTEPAVAVLGEPLGSPVSNAATTSGGGDVPDSEQVVVALRPKFRACYQTHNTPFKAKEGRDIVGMVSCGLHITKEGKVASVSVTRRDRIPYPLMDCIVKELKTAKFAPLPEEAMLQVPVRFRVPGDQ